MSMQSIRSEGEPLNSLAYYPNPPPPLVGLLGVHVGGAARVNLAPLLAEPLDPVASTLEQG